MALYLRKLQKVVLYLCINPYSFATFVGNYFGDLCCMFDWKDILITNVQCTLMPNVFDKKSEVLCMFRP